MPSSVLSPALRALAFATFAAGLLTAGPTHAIDTTLRLHGQLVTSSASTVFLRDDFGSGPGVYLGVEFRLNDRLGIEVGAARIDLEESEIRDLSFLTIETTASLTVTPVTVALDIHLMPGKRYDLYLASKIGWAFFDDFEVATRTEFGAFSLPGFPTIPITPGFGNELGNEVVNKLATDDQFIVGLRLGFDIPFGDSSWSFSSSVDYTAMDLETGLFGGRLFGGIAPTASLDPLAIGVGVGYNF